MHRRSRWILGIGVMLLLVACGGRNAKQAGVDDATPYGSVTSQGLGQSTRFDSDALSGERYSTNAPSNQVYLFAFDNSKVADKYLPSVEAQAEYLKGHPNARVMLAGHTDQVGSREYNVALGERRANAVYHLLRMGGANKSQVRVVSYGKERPVDLEDSPSAHTKNRRVELIYEVVR